jgi:hypothetical protein
MRHIVVLIGLTGLLISGNWKNAFETDAALTKSKEACYSFCGTHQPLAAIENPQTSVNYANDKSRRNNPQKRVPHSFPGNRLIAPLSTSPVSGYSRQFLTKGISLFLLHHFSQSLWKVFRC